jgi:predicted transcriptional regulator
MKNKSHPTPKQKAHALALREAGYTALAVAQKVGVCRRTVNKWFHEHGTKKGSLRVEVVEAARAELVNSIANDDSIRKEIASLIADDMAHATVLKEKMLDALELLQPTNIGEAALTLRASASYATSLKALSDTVRASLKLEHSIPSAMLDELPELIVSELNADEIAGIQQGQTEEPLSPGIGDEQEDNDIIELHELED